MAITNQVSGIPENIKGTRFENISNPYSSLPRTETKWDKFLNWLGFRSGYDKAQEQYNQSYNEYNAQLSQLASEEAYNSPLEQSQRMRQAGLNPDLTGLSGEPASEFDNQQSSPDISAGTDVNPFDVFSNIGNTFLSALSGSMAIFKDISSLKQMRIANDSGDMDLAGKMLDFLTKSDPLYHQYGTVVNGVMDVPFDDFTKSFFRSSRNLKRFNKLRNSAIDSLLGYTNQYKSFDDFYKSAESFGKSASQPYMDNVFPSGSMWSVASAMKPLQEAIYDMNMAQYRAIEKASKYESKVSDIKLSNGSAEAEAEALASGFDANSSENKTRQQLAPLKIDEAKIYSKMLKRLNEMADNGDMFAGLLGMLIGSKTLGAPTFGPATTAFNAVKSGVDALKTAGVKLP